MTKPSRHLFISIFTILTTLLISSVAHAAIPKKINFQGVLTNSTNQNVDDTVDIVFRIYDQDTGDSPLWSETHSDVVVSQGHFSVLLGETTTLNLAFDVPYWVSIQVNSDSEMTPRQPLTSAGYAFRSDLANGLSSPLSSTDLSDSADILRESDIDDGDTTTSNLWSASKTNSEIQANGGKMHFFKSIIIEDPTDSDVFKLFKVPYSLTLDEVSGITDTGTVKFKVREANGSGGSPSDMHAFVTADSDNQDTTVFSNATVDNGDYMILDIGVVSSTPAPNVVTITIEGTED